MEELDWMDAMERELPTMQIRRAAVTEIPLLRALAREIWMACYPGIISVEQIEFMLGWMYSAEQIAREMEAGVEWELLLAGKAVAGFQAYGLEADGRVKLHKLYLRPEAQGHGYARQALEHVLEQARSLGAGEVWLQVNKRNGRAVAAYRKAGFRITSEGTFSIGGGFVMDDYLMAKTLE